MAQICLPHQNFTCGPSHPYTTAFVFQANDGAASPYACQAYCEDGCCYLFNPNARVSLTSADSIGAWVLLGAAVLAGIITSVAVARKVIILNSRLAADFNRLVNEAVNNGLQGPVKEFKGLDVANIICGSAVGGLVSSYAAIGMSFMTAILLWQMSKQQNISESLTWTFPPHAAAITALVASSVLAACVTVIAVGMALTDNRVLIQAGMRKLENMTHAASALVALLAVCLLPLIGGWDTLSGLAFTDVPPDAQTYVQNQVRYNNLLAQQTAMLGIVVSFILQALIGMTFQLLR